MFYTVTIAISSLLIALIHFFTAAETHVGFGTSLLITLSGVAAVIAIDGLLAFVVRRMPEKWFAPEARLFSVGKREQRLYRRLKINAWKGLVPELGCFTGFHKNKLQSSNDAVFLGRFLLESNYGAMGHVAGALCGFAILALPFLPTLSVALPIAAVNFILSWLPTMILRFHTPPLRRLYQRARAKERINSQNSK